MSSQKDPLLPESYSLDPSGVTFETEDEALKTVFDKAEAACLINRKQFADYSVLIEGAKYNGVWLETQPMGGEMYAKRDVYVALCNILIFLRYQRRDGRFPGMITDDGLWRGIVPHYNWMQGCFFAQPALRMWYLNGKDKDYLNTLYEALKDFDEYLWRYRDSDGNGCLESWCIWDTGEDNCTVHMLAGMKMPEHGGWGSHVPPEDFPLMPLESPQYMAYSFGLRETLAEIAVLLQNGEEGLWREKADLVRTRAKAYLWDEKRGAMFPRDKNNEPIYVLTQENIKCLYQGLFTQEMADRFIAEHLLNPEEFWTPVPLPSLAANDPCFHVNHECSRCDEQLTALGTAAKDLEDNSWSGPCEGLTFQRSVDALLRYGHHAETVLVGRRLLAMLKKDPVFAQGYHPFTGEHSPNAPINYGPTVLASLEYISLLCGVRIACDRVLWTGAEEGTYTYTQTLIGHEFTLFREKDRCSCRIDGRECLSFTGDVRAETDIRGHLLHLYGIGSEPGTVTVTVEGRSFERTVKPNEKLAYRDGSLFSAGQIPFVKPGKSVPFEEIGVKRV